MATVTFNFVNGAELTGTSGDDQITLTGTNSPTLNQDVTLVGGAGNDTVVFDGTLGGNFEATAGGFYSDIDSSGTFVAANDEAYFTNGIESFTFDNGTVTSNAAVTTELLLDDALSQAAASASWDVTQLTTYDGSAAGTDTTWSLQTVDGQSLTGSNTVTLLDGTTVLGTLSLNANDVQFAADNAFLGSLDIGETADVSFEIVMTDGTDTFTETVTAVVTGAASDADNNFAASDTVAANVDLLGGEDYATGGLLADTIFGEDGNDTIFAGASDAGNDRFIGGDGDDVIAGGAGDDVIVGDEYIIVNTTGPVTVAEYGATADEGSNTLYGGTGGDAIAIGDVNYSAAGAAATDFTVANIAAGTIDTTNVNSTTGGAAYGGAGNDGILGTAGNDTVGLGDGDDYAAVGNGDDVVYAGADDTGDDTVVATGGDNEIYTGAGSTGVGVGDHVTVGAGDDTVGLGAGDDEIDATAGGDNIVFAGAGDDTVVTGAGDDIIYGGAGADTLTAGAGNDTIYAGTGNDVAITGGAGNDTFVFGAGDGNNTITDFGTGTNVIDVTDFGLAGLGDLVTSTVGGATTIYLDADTTVTLTAVASVDAADFLF